MSYDHTYLDLILIFLFISAHYRYEMTLPTRNVDWKSSHVLIKDGLDVSTLIRSDNKVKPEACGKRYITP